MTDSSSTSSGQAGLSSRCTPEKRHRSHSHRSTGWLTRHGKRPRHLTGAEEFGRLINNVAVTVEHGQGPNGLYQGILLTIRTTQYAGVFLATGLYHDLPSGDLRDLPG
jgi:hypothetical protein